MSQHTQFIQQVPPLSTLGYCMNVHPTIDLQSLLENLANYTAPIHEQLRRSTIPSPNTQLGVGLWLSESVVDQLQKQSNLELLLQNLNSLNLQPFTLNGFPQSNFHQPVVKHRVYEPTWWQKERLSYTKKLAELLAQLLPENSIGSISTLPLSWSIPMLTEQHYREATNNLLEMAEHLERIYENTGRKILLAIEPEPGCAIGDSAAMRKFFLRYLFKTPQRKRSQEYLTVCHDVCHAAVMREDQRQHIHAYRECGIRIGKIQVSSAIYVDWDQMNSDQRREAFAQVTGFAEDRYLHQTTIRNGPVGSVRFAEDLCQVVAGVTAPERLIGNWTIHFHVPIHLTNFGQLQTTGQAIDETIEAISSLPSTPMSNGKPSLPVVQTLPPGNPIDSSFFSGHFEIETYAWSVLPEGFRRNNLVDDILDEFRFFMPKLSSK